MFTRRLAQFIAETGNSDLPAPVVKAAKSAVLDYLAVTLAGSQEPSGKLIGALVKESRSAPEASVIGGNFKASPALAALANGTAGHVLDYDDCLNFSVVGLGHPSTSILPAALALSQSRHIAGRDLITAYCLGIETYAKIGLLTREAFRPDKGWEWTGILGVMGTAAAISKLLKLDQDKTLTALGIAASLASGLTRNFGSMAGHLHAGNAARNGIEAGLLASQGFTAYRDIIEAPSGFYNLFTGSPAPIPETAMNETLQALGNPWNVLDPGLMFKQFPCAHISHFGVDAGLDLKKAHAVDWRQIREIEFRIPSILDRVVAYRDPQTGIQGKFSLGYCLCRALIYGDIKISDFSDESVNDPATRALMSKIQWVLLEQEPFQRPFGYQEVVLKMNNGQSLSCRVDHPRGEPQNPLSAAEHAGKYLACARHAGLNENAASRLKDLVLQLENLEDSAALFAALE